MKLDFHDKTNGLLSCVLSHNTGASESTWKGSYLDPHMNIYDFHRCLLPSRNPVGNFCNVQDMGPNNYFSRKTMKVQTSTSLVLHPQAKSTGLLVLQYCIPLVSK
jgi:hypothetical protein